MCWPWPFIWKIFLKNTILFFFTFLPLSLCSSGDHNVIFDEKEYSPLPPPPPTHERCDDTRETSYVLYTIVRLVEMPRLIDIQYSTWQLASGLSSSLELHCAARPLQKSTCTVYAISRFKVLFRNVHCGIDPRFCRWFYAFDPPSQASDPRSHPFDPWSHIPRYDSVIIF